MGVVHGEWVFPHEAPAPDAVVEGLRLRTGLAITCTSDADGQLEHADIPVIRESLFDWEHGDGRVAVHSFGPAHPYLWAQLDAVMTDLGGQIGPSGNAWRPDSGNAALAQPWSALSKRQRFVLGLPTIGSWRPLDFLATRRD